MKGKRVVVFALPGAFTPTCSSTHLPGYEKHYEAIKACGVDEIYCLSVNDAFVMRQWGLKQGCPEEMKDASNPLNPGNFQKTKLLPDGAVWVALLSRKLRLGPLQTHAKHAALLPQCPAHMPVLSPAHSLPPALQCLFTRGMGMSCTWDSERGFGERSWRYSAVFNDMKIEKLFIEGGAVTQNSGPDPFEVSDADTMLKYVTENKK